jgi:hypothetical protein
MLKVEGVDRGIVLKLQIISYLYVIGGSHGPSRFLRGANCYIQTSTFLIRNKGADISKSFFEEMEINNNLLGINFRTDSFANTTGNDSAHTLTRTRTHTVTIESSVRLSA